MNKGWQSYKFMRDNSGEDVGRSHLVVRMKFKDSAGLKRGKQE